MIYLYIIILAIYVEKKIYISEKNSININNSYINCIDEKLYNDFDIIQNYSSYSSIELNINLTIINNIEEDYRAEIIQHIIDNLINEFNITELNIGKDKKIIDKNKVIFIIITIYVYL